MISVGRWPENGAFEGCFQRRSHTVFPAALTHSAKSRGTWPHHPHFVQLKAQTGTLRNLVASRILFKSRVRPLSLSKMALRGCPSSTLLGASLRLALTRVSHLAVAYISLALCAIPPIQPSPSPQA